MQFEGKHALALCGWGPYLANMCTNGASVPGIYVSDLENAGCILFWGNNPKIAPLAHDAGTHTWCAPCYG